MFFLTLISILFITDTILTHTFPALTLIGLIIFISVVIDEIHQIYQKNKSNFWDRK